MEANQYKLILKNLSLIPEEYLVQVNAYLDKLTNKISHKEENRKKILDLAGSWADMSTADFEEYLGIAKESGNELFGRQIDV